MRAAAAVSRATLEGGDVPARYTRLLASREARAGGWTRKGTRRQDLPLLPTAAPGPLAASQRPKRMAEGSGARSGPSAQLGPQGQFTAAAPTCCQTLAGLQACSTTMAWPRTATLKRAQRFPHSCKTWAKWGRPLDPEGEAAHVLRSFKAAAHRGIQARILCASRAAAHKASGTAGGTGGGGNSGLAASFPRPSHHNNITTRQQV